MSEQETKDYGVLTCECTSDEGVAWYATLDEAISAYQKALEYDSNPSIVKRLKVTLTVEDGE